MYRLNVHNPGSAEAVATHQAGTSSEVLDLLSELLRIHPECERIAVFQGDRLLFEVSCGGFPLRS